MANQLVERLKSAIGQGLQSDGQKVVFLNEELEEAYQKQLREQAAKLGTPRTSTAPGSLENFQKAGQGQIDLTRGYNRALEEHGHNMFPLKEKSSHLRTDEYGRNLAAQVDAMNKTRARTHDHAEQIQYDRTHVSLPALMALEEKRIDDARTDKLLGRLLQGAGALGILFG